MSPTAIAISTTCVFLGLFVLERFRPLRLPVHALWPRIMVNVVVSALAFAVAAVLVRPAAMAVLGSSLTRIGLFGFVSMPTWMETAIGFLLLDLSFYYWHVANHRVPLLWRFHNVHHIDPDLDVSTAFRFHVGEIAFSAAFRVVQITLIGLSLGTYLIYEAVFQAGTAFHHSNLRLPIHVERWLCLVFVTPRMHGIHHSHVQRETNSNYSTVLSWWDRLHRTLRLNIPQRAIRIGVPAYALPDDNGVWNALCMPFRRQRDYWRSPDGSEPTRSPPEPLDGQTTLAE